MDNHADLDDFSGRCRMFPLPNLVLFPHAILPLHIFEPRYRQMTDDALASDQLVTIVQVKPMIEGTPWTEPVPVMEVGCLGRIVEHERLPDGRFYVLLQGCKRVRLEQELPSPKLYRIARATILEDQDPSMEFENRREALIDLFLQSFDRPHPLDADLSRMMNSGVPLGVLTDFIAHILELPARCKQSLLEETLVENRVTTLQSILQKLVLSRPTSRHYPPPISLN
jgi:uncharacterized protein